MFASDHRSASETGHGSTPHLSAFVTQNAKVLVQIRAFSPPLPAINLSQPHRTCSARRSLKCPAVWVWLAFSFCHLCCCRPWPWRKNRLHSSRKMRPAQPLSNSTRKSSQHSSKTLRSLSKHKLRLARPMKRKTADPRQHDFPTQSLTRYRCD